MACNCDISFTYVLAPSETTGVDPITIGPISLTQVADINGHSAYQFNDNYYGLLTWQYLDSSWVVIDSDANVAAYLINSSELECPGISGEYGGTNWEITGAIIIFDSLTTYVCTPAPVCVEWASPGNTVPDYLVPYNLYLIYVDIDLTELYIGQPVESFTHSNPLNIGGTGQYYIASILYEYDEQIFSTYTPGANQLGIILQDSEGTIMWPNANNGGGICFQPKNYTTTDQTNKECFDKLVWEKQCEFSQSVLNYLRQLQFGNISPNTLDNLKNQRRILEILNCYDTRDIAYNTTDYNALTYNQIKKLLNN